MNHYVQCEIAGYQGNLDGKPMKVPRTDHPKQFEAFGVCWIPRSTFPSPNDSLVWEKHVALMSPDQGLRVRMS
jgi:hypothetical protein